jgi:hypothetical protein
MLDWLDIVLRLAAATLTGSLIGIYLELQQKPTGMRTLGLVALASAVAVLAVAKDPDADASRVIQGVVTGVGFLGAGVILHRATGRQVVHGLSDCGDNLDYCILRRIMWSRCLVNLDYLARPNSLPVIRGWRDREVVARASLPVASASAHPLLSRFAAA